MDLKAKPKLFSVMKYTSGARLRKATITMTCVGALFLLFMGNVAPMGLKAPEYHRERITNSVDGILNGRLLPRLGLTTWNNRYETEAALQKAGEDQKKLYLVNIAPYVHYAILKLLNPRVALETISRIADYVTVLITGALLLGVANETFRQHEQRLLLSCSTYLLYISSVWTYRAILAPSKEFLMLPLLLAAILAETRKRRKVSWLLLATSSIVDYHWGFFIFASYCPIYIYLLLRRDAKWITEILPPSSRNGASKEKIAFCTLTLTGALVASIQKIALGQLHTGLTTVNSNLLYRVGIDSASNIHYSGIIGPLQFLMGQRLNVCLPGSRSGLEASIFTFNCSLTLLSCFLIAVVSVSGILLLAKDARTRWMLWPAITSFSMFALLFPQSWAAHPGIYSYMFTPIFALGAPAAIASAASRFFNTYKIPIMMTVYPSAIAAIMINSIRVSFLTGPNA